MLMFFLLKLVVSLSLHFMFIKCLHVTTCCCTPCTGKFSLAPGACLHQVVLHIHCKVLGIQQRCVLSDCTEPLWGAIMFEHGSVGEDFCMGSSGISSVVLGIIKNPVWLTALWWWAATLGYWSWKCGLLKAAEEPRAWHWISAVRAGCSQLGKLCVTGKG